MYKINISKEEQQEFIDNCYLNEFEILIFNELIKGTKRKDIGKIIEKKYCLSFRTTQRRIKKIIDKIEDYKQGKQETYKVYIHKFPNGKKYVGVCQNCQDRWTNGLGYAYNKEMFKAIKQFGWENIEHKVLFETSDRYIAYSFEKILIEELDLIKSGYNNIL